MHSSVHSPLVFFQNALLSISKVTNVALKLLDFRMHVPDMADEVPPPAESHVAMRTPKIFLVHVDAFDMFFNVLLARGLVGAQVARYHVFCCHMNVPDVLLDLTLRSGGVAAKVAFCILDLLVNALLVPPQVVDLEESLSTLLADMILHVGMNRPRVCLWAKDFLFSWLD